MKNVNVVIMFPFVVAIVFIFAVPARAIVWADGNPGNIPPNAPIQQQQARHEEHPNGPSHVQQQQQSHQQAHQPQQRVAPMEKTPQKLQPTQADKTLNHHMQSGQDWHNYIRRDYEYYGQDNAPYPVADVDTDTPQIPDGYETVNVNGQIYYFSDGVFYQLVAGDLTPIQPVIGAIVSDIPTDYQIVMADDQHYLFTQGVYYQRIDQGFLVVAPPDAPDA